MNTSRTHSWIAVLILSVVMSPVVLPAQTASLGIFENHGDVGTVLHPGSVEYDSAHKTYTITGSGENMWATQDAFQFVWKKMSGDVSLTADISFLTKTGNEHKKAALMFRQTLDADSVYADIAVHSSGLTALQFRDEKGAITREIESNAVAPKRVRIVKRGDYVYMSVAGDEGEPQPAGGWLRVPLQGSFYVGIGMCAHDKDVSETAVFSNVDLMQPAPSPGQPVLYSALETIPVDGPQRHVHYLTQGRFEAPNWTRDGKAFLFNRDGRIERLEVGSDKPEKIDTGFATRCNNDHGISPDGKELAISDNSQGDHESQVYIVPIAGGQPRPVTDKSPSYWHGWSPDGKTIAFVGQRGGDFDIYAIAPGALALTRKGETRLTTAKGLDDGPEYSPDGNYIYFNSERTGHMQIWRMKSDGSDQEQVFSDDLNNWFPHISPDGKWMVFLTYAADVKGHPENKDVMLRLMSLADKKIIVLTKLFGGQGTINVPSWSPDSTKLAFVSYMLVPPDEATATSSALLSSVIAELRHKTTVPLRIPGKLPSLDAAGQFYPIVKSASHEEYAIVLGATPDCDGQHACSYGTLLGTTRSTSQIDGYDFNNRKKQTVALEGGLRGYVYEPVCGAYCSDSAIIWTEGRYQYVIGLKAGSSSELIAAANSTIRATSRPE